MESKQKENKEEASVDLTLSFLITDEKTVQCFLLKLFVFAVVKNKMINK